MDVKINIIKRNGKEVDFDVTKITNAIRKANNEIDKLHRLNEYQIEAIGDMIAPGSQPLDPRGQCGRYSGHGRDGNHEYARI